jgi:hypothetical protein
MRLSADAIQSRISRVAFNLREFGLDNIDIARVLETDRKNVSALISYERKKMGIIHKPANDFDPSMARIPCRSDPLYNVKLRAWKASLEANR